MRLRGWSQLQTNSFNKSVDDNNIKILIQVDFIYTMSLGEDGELM